MENEQNQAVNTQEQPQPVSTETFQELPVADIQPQAPKSHKGLVIGFVLVLILALGAGYLYSTKMMATEVPVLSSPARTLTVGADMDQVYTDSHYHFNITPPRGWAASEGQMGAAVFFYESQSGTESFKTNINVVREVVTQGTTSYDYVTKSLNQMKQVIGGYQAVSVERVKIASGDGYLVVGSFKMGSISIVNSQLYYVKGNEAYVVTGTSRKENWADNKRAFESSLSTFSLAE